MSPNSSLQTRVFPLKWLQLNNPSCDVVRNKDGAASQSSTASSKNHANQDSLNSQNLAQVHYFDHFPNEDFQRQLETMKLRVHVLLSGALAKVVSPFVNVFPSTESPDPTQFQVRNGHIHRCNGSTNSIYISCPKIKK